MAISTMYCASVFFLILNEIGVVPTVLTGCLDKYAEAELSNFLFSISRAMKLSMLGAIFLGLVILFILIDLIMWLEFKEPCDLPMPKNSQLHYNVPNDAVNTDVSGYSVELNNNLGVV